MNLGIDLMVANLGIDFEWIICIVSLLACLPFFAKDFKFGIFMEFLSFGVIFVWFYEQSYNFVIPLVIFLIFLVIMVLSLIPINRTSPTGGFT